MITLIKRKNPHFEYSRKMYSVATADNYVTWNIQTTYAVNVHVLHAVTSWRVTYLVQVYRPKKE